MLLPRILPVGDTWQIARIGHRHCCRYCDSLDDFFFYPSPAIVKQICNIFLLACMKNISTCSLHAMPIRPEIAQTFCPQAQATVTFCQLLRGIYDSGKPSDSHGKAAPHRKRFSPWVRCQHPLGTPFAISPSADTCPCRRLPDTALLPSFPFRCAPQCTGSKTTTGRHLNPALPSGPRQGWRRFARAKPVLFSSQHPQPSARKHVPCISRLSAV